MLILPQSCFLHVPKTGGIWATRAIRAAVRQVEEYAPGGDPHRELAECPCAEKFKMAFVRHPVDSYRSYWQYKMGAGWDDQNPQDPLCRSDDFPTFVSKVLQHFPGICSVGFERFTGPRTAPIEFIGKFESLVDDLVRGLSLAGEGFDEPVIRATPPQNVSDRRRFPAELPAELEQAIRETEHEAMERYGYT